MNHIYRNLLIRYQNYLLEFYQLIEDKFSAKLETDETAQNIKQFLENIPEFESDFEIAYDLKRQSGELTVTWSVYISHEGFSVRSFSLDDYLEEVDEWYFHYHVSTSEYEGNLFTDGDWDLFLEEVAEVDEENEVTYELTYKVA